MATLTDDKSEPSYTDNHDNDYPPPGAAPPCYSEATESDPPESTLPSFPEPSASGSSTSKAQTTLSSSEPLAHPTNYLTIERPNSQIRGTYSIDPSLPASPGAVISKDENGNNLNVRLFSMNAYVDVTLDVVRGANAKGPAKMDVGSKNASVDVTVHDRRQNRFHLRAVSPSGHVTVHIPETFIGNVYSKVQNGRMTFHSRIKPHLTTLSELHNEARHFIGDFTAHGYEDEETWHMDHLHLESQKGNIDVNFISNPDSVIVNSEDSSESDPPESLPSFPEPSVSGSSTSQAQTTSSSFEPLTRPTNYLTIERQNLSIRDTYSINPSLPAPPGAVISKDENGNNLNLRLFSTNFSVKVILDVVRGADAKGPARMDVSSENGSTEVTVHDRRQNRFHLRSVSQNGHVTVHIPETFIGSVYSKAPNGRMTFHSRFKPHLTTLSEVQNEARHFIGDFTAHRYEDEEMDHLHLESQNGNINVNFILNSDSDAIANPEDSSPSPSKGTEKGFFSRLLWG